MPTPSDTVPGLTRTAPIAPASPAAPPPAVLRVEVVRVRLSFADALGLVWTLTWAAIAVGLVLGLFAGLGYAIMAVNSR